MFDTEQAGELITGWLEYAHSQYVDQAMTPEWLTLYRDDHARIELKALTAGAWVQTAWNLAPMDRSLAERLWLGIKDRFLVERDQGSHLTVVVGARSDDPGATCAALALAIELGDDDATQSLNAWVETQYRPTSADDQFYFTFGRDEPHPRGQWNNAAARSLVGAQGSWARLFRDPAPVNHPHIIGLDYRRFDVVAARYDAGRLRFEVAPLRAGALRFQIINLADPGSVQLPGARVEVTGSDEATVETDPGPLLEISCR